MLLHFCGTEIVSGLVYAVEPAILDVAEEVSLRLSERARDAPQRLRGHCWLIGGIRRVQAVDVSLILFRCWRLLIEVVDPG